MEKYYYGYEEFVKDTKVLTNKCREFQPEVLLAVARGGLTLGHFMAHALKMKNLYTLNSVHYDGSLKLDTCNVFNIPDISHAHKVLILDELVDSGETMEEVLKLLKRKFPKVEFKLATLFYKKDSIVQPDYSVKEAKGWIDFFWEVDVE